MTILRYNPGAMPAATLALVALNIVVAAGDIATGAWFERSLWARGIDIYYGEFWRIPGCALVHADLVHLAFNCFGIYVLGRVLETLQGWRVVLIVYAVSALGGSALGVAFNDPATPMLGASGAAYGLMGAVLAWFYVRTGSVQGVLQVPFSRIIAIWFLFGIWVSLQPGISLLGHLGGFVPGALLGAYFEYRYTRRLDQYHRLAAGSLVAAVILACVYAAWPWHRGDLAAVRALRAYEAGEYSRGDELLGQARKRGTREGGARLIQHLEVWREGRAGHPGEFTLEVLRLPLSSGSAGPDGRPRRPHFLQRIEPQSLEPAEPTP